MNELSDNHKQLLTERRIASVATIDSDGYPHLTSVWFLYENGALYLAIPSSSGKGRNLARNPKLAVMIDTRVSHRETGITAIGEAEVISGGEAVQIVQRLHAKYLSKEALSDPQVGPVFAAIDDIAVKIVPRKWLSWDMGQLDAQVFGGAMARNQYLKEIVP